jgi:hypothetical protein
MGEDTNELTDKQKLSLVVIDAASIRTTRLKDLSETIRCDMGSPSCTIASITGGDSVNS